MEVEKWIQLSPLIFSAFFILHPSGPTNQWLAPLVGEFMGLKFQPFFWTKALRLDLTYNAFWMYIFPNLVRVVTFDDKKAVPAF